MKAMEADPSTSIKTGSPKLPLLSDWLIFASQNGIADSAAVESYRWFERQLQAGA
jgi:hypothetical protein